MNNLINQDVIDNLIEIGDKEFLIELIDIFLAQSEELIQEIRQSVETSNGPELMKASHKLKGSCLNLGASELGDICAQLETSGIDSDFSRIGKILEPLDSVYKQTCSELIKLK